jgi:hypothetical protein
MDHQHQFLRVHRHDDSVVLPEGILVIATSFDSLNPMP